MTVLYIFALNRIDRKAFLGLTTQADNTLRVLLAIVLVLTVQLFAPCAKLVPNAITYIGEHLQSVLDFTTKGFLYILHSDVVLVHQILLNVLHQIASMPEQHFLECSFLVLGHILSGFVHQTIENLVELVQGLLTYKQNRSPL